MHYFRSFTNLSPPSEQRGSDDRHCTFIPSCDNG